MPLTRKSIDRIIVSFRSDLDRAESLYDRIVMAGATRNSDGTYSALRQPDRRDAAQFIFFEAAARFETFCNNTFKIEVRYEFEVRPQRADFIMGNIDQGLEKVMGWSSPTMLQRRARALFGKRGFFARLETRLGSQTYDRLTQAHKVRNRIAHTGGRASKEFIKILGKLHVPQRSRRGLSVGCLLTDYPINAQDNDRWFHRFVASYRNMSDEFRKYIERLV